MAVARVSKTLTLSAAFLAAATLTACGSSEKHENRTFYCTTRDGTVVPEDRCDNGSGGGGGGDFFLWHSNGNTRYAPGQKVPLSKGERFPYNDSASRAKWGLPTTGRVSNGSVKTGVVGKGGAPAGSKGGSGS